MSDQAKSSQPAPARVVVVDDHPIVREGLAQVIEHRADLTVCGEAGSAAEALDVIAEARPDVAIVDLSLRDRSGLDLIKDVAARFPDVSVLVLSMRGESPYVERALRAGARGYVTKEEGTAKVIDGIRAVLRGQMYLSEKMSAEVLRRMLPARGQSAADLLSDRELEVLARIGAGEGTAEIARNLELSVKTIETYRERIKQKLDLDDAAELLKYAIAWARSQDDR